MAYLVLTLTPGDYKFTFSCPGYESVIVAVHVNEHEMSDFNIILKQSVSSDKNEVTLSESNRILKVLNSEYMQISELKSIGKTSTGNVLTSLRISSQKHSKFEKPSLVFLSGIGTGDPLTSKVLVSLASHILKNQEKSKRIKSLLDKVDFYFVPEIHSVNETKTCSKNSKRDPKFIEPLDNDEKMLVNWLEEINPLLTVNLRTGARTIQTPLNAREFEEFLKDLESEYKKFNPLMNPPNSKCQDGEILNCL